MSQRVEQQIDFGEQLEIQLVEAIQTCPVPQVPCPHALDDAENFDVASPPADQSIGG